jgi:hypothetical protein
LWNPPPNMEFLNAAGITTDALIPLHDVQEKTNTIHELFNLHRKWLPARLKKSGDRMVEAPDNARALLSFLRHAARLEGSLIWSQKKQGQHADGVRKTSIYSYKLLSATTAEEDNTQQPEAPGDTKNKEAKRKSGGAKRKRN